MSGALLNEVADFAGLRPQLDALRDALGLRGLRPGSFRGIPFHLEGDELSSGRRVVVNEFPERDGVSTQDLGRRRREVSIEAFVLGEDWQERRDLLLLACEAFDKPGTLVLPGGFEVVARCTECRVSHREGRMARFSLAFVEAGEPATLLRAPDTAALLRAAIGRALRLVRTAFALAAAVRGLGDFVRRAAVAGLREVAQDMAGIWLGLPGLDLAGTARAIAALDAADPENPLEAVLAPSAALADAALLVPSRRAAAGTIATSSRGEVPAARRDAALALLAHAARPGAAAAPAPGVVAALVARNAAALDALDRDAAALRAAALLSEVEFTSSADAASIRARLLAALAARAEAAAAAGQDDLFRAWREVAAAAARDLAERARRAPVLSAYALRQPMASLALAHRLLGSAAAADALVALNDAPHPGFLPAAGLVLRP